MITALGMVWRPRGAQTLRSLQFGDPKASKPCAHCNLGIRRRPNITPTVVWRTQGAQNLRLAGKPIFFFLGPAGSCSFFCRARQAVPYSAQTLCALCSGESKTPKTYASYGLETQRRPHFTLIAIWRPQGVQTLCAP